MNTHPKRARLLTTRVAVAAAGLCLVSGSVLAAPSDAATSASPMAFGMFPGSATSKALQGIEASMGRSAAYVRVYRSWDDAFPDSNINAIRASGHTLFLSIKARLKGGQNVSWQQIADAQPGSSLYTNMVRWATAIKSYGMPMFVSFNHEPDTSNSQPSGTAAQFVLAWQKFVSVMRSEGVTNARLAWTVAVRNFSVSPSNKKYAPKYYPGDAWVDDISVDAYNMYCLTKSGQPSNPWRSLGQLLDPFMQFVAGHPGPSLVLAEWGSPEDPRSPGRKAAWIADAQQLFKQPAYGRFVAISYWNQLSHTHANCDFGIASSPSALSAFQTMGADPFYSGAVT